MLVILAFFVKFEVKNNKNDLKKGKNVVVTKVSSDSIQQLMGMHLLLSECIRIHNVSGSFQEFFLTC